MTCRYARNHLADLLPPTLDQNGCHELRSHMEACPTCSREYEAMKRVLGEVEPGGKIRASADFKERVMRNITNDSVISEPPMRRAIPVIWKFAAAAGLAVILVCAWPRLVHRNGTRALQISPVTTLLAQSMESISRLDSVHMLARMRTLPGDNFELIGLDYDFVPIEMWKQFGSLPRWRIEKPGRVVVMDGTSSLLLIKPNHAARGGPNPGFVEWLRPLLDVDQLLDKELRMARQDLSVARVTEEQHNSTRRLILTINRKAQGDFANDWLRNRSIIESDHTRVYRFDAATKRLEGLQVYIHSGGRDVLVFEIADIRYNEPVDPTLFSVPLPENVVWLVRPGEMPTAARALPQTPKETAVAFFEGLSREEWDQVLAVYPVSSLDVRLKEAYGRLEVLRIGEPFRSGLYSGWFIPYEIRLSSGYVKKHNLAVRNDNPTHRFVVDGGF